MKRVLNLLLVAIAVSTLAPTLSGCGRQEQEQLQTSNINARAGGRTYYPPPIYNNGQFNSGQSNAGRNQGFNFGGVTPQVYNPIPACTYDLLRDYSNTNNMLVSQLGERIRGGRSFADVNADMYATCMAFVNRWGQNYVCSYPSTGYTFYMASEKLRCDAYRR